MFQIRNSKMEITLAFAQPFDTRNDGTKFVSIYGERQ